MRFSCFAQPGDRTLDWLPQNLALCVPSLFLVEEVALGCLWWQGLGLRILIMKLLHFWLRSGTPQASSAELSLWHSLEAPGSCLCALMVMKTSLWVELVSSPKKVLHFSGEFIFLRESLQ